LLPGTPLSEKDLVESLGVSRTPVREALLKLADDGLVEVYPQSGTFVSPISTSEVLDSQFVREALETTAVANAIERITASDVEQLRENLAQQRALHRAGQLDQFIVVDEAFHASIFRIAGHEAVWTVVTNAKHQMDRVRHLTIKQPRKPGAVITEHAEVVNGLERGDAAAAVAAMRTHLRGVFRSIELLAAENPDYFAPARRAIRRAASAGTAVQRGGGPR
jgi:DNA-binding GntR family transcriptional regulator